MTARTCPGETIVFGLCFGCVGCIALGKERSLGSGCPCQEGDPQPSRAPLPHMGQSHTMNLPRFTRTPLLLRQGHFVTQIWGHITSQSSLMCLHPKRGFLCYFIFFLAGGSGVFHVLSHMYCEALLPGLRSLGWNHVH